MESKGQEEDEYGGSIWRPPTPFIDEKGQSKGWEEVTVKGWTFISQTRPASGTPEREKLAEKLHVQHVPLPEMLHGNNFLMLKNEETGLSISFNAHDALQDWSSQQESSNPWTAVHFDHLYRSKYKGTLLKDPKKLRTLLSQTKRIEAPRGFAEAMPCRETIPLEKLKQHESILFYSNTILYEDELGDVGNSSMTVKIRVMPFGFLVLLRFYVRVDYQFVNLYDTRYYHEFGKPYILRDFETREATMNELFQAASKERPFTGSIDNKQQQDPQFFTNPDFVYSSIKPNVQLRDSILCSLN